MRSWPRPPGRRVVRRAATVALAVLLTGCASGAVRVPPPTPTGHAIAGCRDLVRKLPSRLVGLHRRPVEPADSYVAAWGSPPIALRCGVPKPAALRPESQLAVVNGISWFAEPADRPHRFTALGRQAYVEVNVPPTYMPAGPVLGDISSAISRTIPERPFGEL